MIIDRFIRRLMFVHLFIMLFVMVTYKRL